MALQFRPPIRIYPRDVADFDRLMRTVLVTPDPGTADTSALADKAVTNAKLRDSAALSVIGRAANSIGIPADIAASANDRLLARISDALAFVQLTLGMAPNDLWTYAKLQNVSATDRLLGRSTAGAGDIEEIPCTGAGRALLDDADAAAQRITLGLWTPVKKTADETISSDATLSNDAALLFAMAANTKYSFRARIFFDTSAVADFKYRHSGPAAPTLVRIHRRELNPGGVADLESVVDTAYSSADVAVTSIAGTDGGYIELDGIIHNGVNAGDFNFQWAQNTSDASNTTVRAGSYLEWLQL